MARRVAGRVRRLASAVVAAACLAGWGGLVVVAVRAGRDARAGETSAWWLAGVAVAGAVVLLLAGGWLLVTAVRSPPSRPDRPSRTPGRRVRR